MSTTFGFGTTQGHVGEPLPAQVVITSHARQSTAPIVLSHVSVSFEGGLKDVKIEHEVDTEPTQSTSDEFSFYDITLITSPNKLDSTKLGVPSPECLLGMSNLTLGPGDTKILSMNLVPKGSGTVQVASITSVIETNSFEVELNVSAPDYIYQEGFWFETTQGIGLRPAGSESMNGIRIHPRPPRMQINVPQLRKEYLTDETVRLDVEISNEEDEDAEVTLEARFLGRADAVPTWTWINDYQNTPSPPEPLSDQKDIPTPSYNIGLIERSGNRTINAKFTAKSSATEAVLEIKAVYHVPTDPDSSITKVLVKEIIFDRPFEANYDFQPSLDKGALPNYFSISENFGSKQSAQGLRQLWNTTARLASFASESLVIQDVKLEVIDVHDSAICTIEPTVAPDVRPLAVIGPNEFHESRFDINSQKLDLDDRQSTVIQFQLEVRWRRNEPDAPITTTILAVPDLVIPFGEPRVLAAAGSVQGEESEFIPLDYTIENPSTHVLNFEISMETNEDFAFSGPKATTVQLVPISRHTVKYNIVPLVRGKWITPHLRVLDTHFNQVLKVHGIGAVRSDKRGASIWIDAEE